MRKICYDHMWCQTVIYISDKTLLSDMFCIFVQNPFFGRK